MCKTPFLIALAILVAVPVALATPTPVPIPITTPPPPPPQATPAVVCVWIQMKGPGPFPFTPAPGQDIRDVEVDIPGDELLPPIVDGYLPQYVQGSTGPFASFEMIAELFEAEYGLHVNVGHWYDGQFLMGTVIEVGNPGAGSDDTWYVHFTPEPATLALLTMGGLAVLARRRRS